MGMQRLARWTWGAHLLGLLLATGVAVGPASAWAQEDAPQPPGAAQTEPAAQAEPAAGNGRPVNPAAEDAGTEGPELAEPTGGNRPPGQSAPPAGDAESVQPSPSDRQPGADGPTPAGAPPAGPLMPPVDRWLEAAQRAEFRPISAEQLDERRRALRQAVDRLNAFLRVGGPAKERPWKAYLSWNELNQADQATEAEQLDRLEEIGGRLYSGYPGLELPPFVEVRETLTRYVGLARSRGDERLPEAFAQQLEGLQDDLRRYGSAPSAATRQALGARLEWFESVGQIPGLIEAIRAAHRAPNLQIYASGDLVNQVVGRPISEVAPVRDVILGTSIFGSALTTGQLSAELVSSPDSAAFLVRMSAVAHSQTTGYEGPVTVRNRSVTTLDGQKLFLLPEFGGMRSLPASVTACTDSQIECLAARPGLGSRLIQRIGLRQARQRQPLAERIAADHAARRAEAQMDQQGLQLVADGNHRLRRDVIRPLTLRGLYPSRIGMATEPPFMRTTVLQARAAQLGALRPAPSRDLAKLTILVHETLINNSAETALAGLELTDQRTAELMEELTGSVPAELQPGPENEPWSITFAFRQPVTVAFEGGLVEIALAGRRFRRGDGELVRPMRIAARYRAELGPDGARLIRQGELDITFLGREGEQLGVREVAYKTFMLRKFDELFKPVIEGEGLALPGRLQQLGRRPLAVYTADDGWLTLGWN